jgi:hypothetical protein
MIRARIKGSPLKMCYGPWFKHFVEHLAGSKVAACIGHRGGHQGATLLEHFHKHIGTNESNGKATILATATSAAMMGGTNRKCATLHLSMALMAWAVSNLFMTTIMEPSESSPMAKSNRP